MKYTLPPVSVRILALGVALLAWGAIPLPAQDQPVEASNAQDEYLNINKEVEAETSQFTIFRSGDKAEINRYISEVIELDYAVALEVLPHVLKAVSREKGDARSLKYKDPNTGKERYFLQVITTPEQMPSVLATIRALDLPEMTSSSGLLYHHQRLKYRRASEVATLISDTVLSSEGKAFADDATNTVYIEDSQSDGERDVATLNFYDVPPPQVEFDVLAVELEEDKTKEIGLDWEAWKRALGGQVQFAGSRIEGGEGFARLDTLLTLDAQALASFLNFTAQTGTGRVATRTKITASNNRPGVVSSLRQVPSLQYAMSRNTPEVVSVMPPSAMEETGEWRDHEERPLVAVPPTDSVLENRTAMNTPGASALDPSLLEGPKAEGIYLLIQPNIGTEMVTADIRVVVNSLSGYTKLDEPIITERLLDTAVTLKDKEPFTLGGLDKETSAQIRRGIPGLKDIPGIRSLFSVEKETRMRSKIFMVITPEFKNQVVFNAPILLSSHPTVEPANVVNEAVAVPDVEALLKPQKPE